MYNGTTSSSESWYKLVNVIMTRVPMTVMTDGHIPYHTLSFISYVSIYIHCNSIVAVHNPAQFIP